MRLKFTIGRENLKCLRTSLRIFIQHNKQTSTYLYFDDENVIIFGDRNMYNTTDCRIHLIPKPDVTQTYCYCFMTSYEISSKQERNRILLKVLKFDELLDGINFIGEDDGDGEFKLTKVEDKNGSKKQIIRVISTKDSEDQKTTSLAFEIETVFEVDKYPEMPFIGESKVGVDKIVSETLFKNYLKFGLKEKENTVLITALKKTDDSQSISSKDSDFGFDYLEVMSDKHCFKCYSIESEEETEIRDFRNIFEITLTQYDFYRIFSALLKARFNIEISYSEPTVCVYFTPDESAGITLIMKAQSIIED